MTAVRAELATATAAQNFAASNLLATQADTATGTDTKTASGTMPSSMSELATATDAPSAIANLLAAIAEIATASDEVNAGRGFFVTVTESAVGSHTQTATARFNGSIQELATGLDAYGRVKDANVYPAGIQLNVYVGQVLVWGTIPTGQTPPAPDWTEIPT
jgi:hypothetical protein